MINDDFIKFMVKIVLLFAAGLVPLMLGGKIASSISGQIQSLTKKMRENSFSRSRGAQANDRRYERKANKAARRADDRELGAVETKQGLLGRALNSRRLEGEKAKPGLRGVAARYASDKGWGRMDEYDRRRGQLKGGMEKTDSQAADMSEKQHKIDSLVGKFGRRMTDANGNPMSRQVTVQDPRTNTSSLVDVPEYEFDPNKMPALMKDKKAQQDALSLNAAGLSDDNNTGRERVVRQIPGALLGANDNVGIEASGKSGPHNHWSVPAQLTNGVASRGMGRSKVAKADFETVTGWQSNWPALMGEDIKEMEIHATKHGGLDALTFRGTNSETNTPESFSPRESIVDMQKSLRGRFASDDGMDTFLIPEHATERHVKMYQKLISQHNPINNNYATSPDQGTTAAFTPERAAEAQRRINQWYGLNGGGNVGGGNVVQGPWNNPPAA